MKRFQVTWGEHIRTINAADQSEAWGKFCDELRGRVPSIERNPKMHRREIAELVPEIVPTSKLPNESINAAHKLLME